MNPASGVEPSPRVPRWLGFAAGAALLAAAVFMVLRHPDDLSRSLRAAQNAPLWAIALAILFPVVNCGLMALLFWLLTQRRAPGRVPLGEMAALIGSAWLLNYIPLRPGLVGRVALHRALHDIPLRDSALVLAQNIACGAVAIVLAIGGILLAGLDPRLPPLAVIVASLILPPALGALVLRGTLRVWSAGTLIRGADLCAWSARYFIAALIAGRDLTAPESIAFASVSQIAMLVPLAGNGLGLREWAIGVTAASLPAAWATDAHAATSATGLLIDLINRAAEMVGAVPVGLVCSALVARRVARGRTQ